MERYSSPQPSAITNTNTNTMSSIYSLPHDEVNGEYDAESHISHLTESIAPPQKLLNVTITMLSLTGVQAKESGKKKSMLFTRGRSKSSSSQLCEDGNGTSEFNSSMANASNGNASPITTLVASFERNTNTEKVDGDLQTIMTHVPSLPLKLPAVSSSKRNATFRDSIHWPEQDDGTHSKLSSFTFQRMFPQEAKPHSTTAASSPRYVQPQLCPIQVSISRNGKMYKLGSAHVFVSGEEGKNELQQPSIRNIPVVNFDNAFKNSMSMGIGGNHNNKAQLMRLRGDTLKCGLADGAALRVLVRVSDPAVDQIQDQAKANIMPKFQMTTDQSNYMNMLSPSSRMGIRIFDLTSNDDTPVMERNTTVLTVASTTRSVMSSDEASWEYDPSQSAVVIKKKKKTMMPRNNEIIKDTTMHSNLIGVDGARNKDGYTRTRSDTSASAASSDANTNDVSQSSSMASSSDAEDSRDVLSRFSYATDDCSLYSDSSSQLIKLINDISSKTRDRSNVTTDVMTMSSSVQSYQQRRRGGRTQHTSGTDTRAHHNAHNINVKGGDDATISTCSSGISSSSNSSTSIASPPLIPRAADALRSAIFQRSSACTSSHHNDGRGSSSQGRSSPPSGVKHWTKRLICCGSIADEDGGECTFLSPIIDEDNSLDYDQTDYDYSLEGREWSDLELE